MEGLIQKFLNVKVYKESGREFLHKPLLLIYMLGQVYQGNNRLVSFCKIDQQLMLLFDKFYPQASIAKNTHYPFGRLENDGIWEVTESKTLSRTSVGHLLKSELLERNISGGFTQEIYLALRGNKGLIIKIATELLNRFFPDAVHSDILESVGIHLNGVNR